MFFGLRNPYSRDGQLENEHLNKTQNYEFSRYSIEETWDRSGVGWRTEIEVKHQVGRGNRS